MKDPTSWLTNYNSIIKLIKLRSWKWNFSSKYQTILNIELKHNVRYIVCYYIKSRVQNLYKKKIIHLVKVIHIVNNPTKIHISSSSQIRILNITEKVKIKKVHEIKKNEDKLYTGLSKNSKSLIYIQNIYIRIEIEQILSVSINKLGGPSLIRND